jgi:hypothetical protein
LLLLLLPGIYGRRAQFTFAEMSRVGAASGFK